MGVLAWAEACDPNPTITTEGSDKPSAEETEEPGKPAMEGKGDDNADKDGAEREQEALDAFRKAKISECQANLDKAAGWEAFVLDARCGMRVQTGTESLKWYRRRMGWR